MSAIQRGLSIGLILLAVSVIYMVSTYGPLRPKLVDEVKAQNLAGEEQTLLVPTANLQSPATITGGLYPGFAPSVLYWEPELLSWSSAYGLDPNLMAIVMQFESCGNPTAGSSAGAQGLFQVMPFHFSAGEDMHDPDTNARRGFNYFVEGLTNYHSGSLPNTFAGYNGGHGRTRPGTSISDWPNETQRYHQLTTGLYSDIQNGSFPSPTLEAWYTGNGTVPKIQGVNSFCRDAVGVLGGDGVVNARLAQIAQAKATASQVVVDPAQENELAANPNAQAANLAQPNQTECLWQNPAREFATVRAAMTSVNVPNMHAVGRGAIPGVDGSGLLYPAFSPAVLASKGFEINPSGLESSYLRIEGTGPCSGWVMYAFHLGFDSNLDRYIGQPIPLNVPLGIDSMSGVAKQFWPHWHLSLCYKGQRPPGIGADVEVQSVNAGVGLVYCANPTFLDR